MPDMIKIKCTSCEKEIKKDDEIAMTGRWPVLGLLLPPVLNYPYLKNMRLYHKACCRM